MTDKQRHTPGPWRHDNRHIFADASVVAIACLVDARPGGRSRYDEATDNARLIAAAPEMYAALEHARKVMNAEAQHIAIHGSQPPPSLFAAIGHCEIAMAKARGETP